MNITQYRTVSQAARDLGVTKQDVFLKLKRRPWIKTRRVANLVLLTASQVRQLCVPLSKGRPPGAENKGLTPANR